MDIIKIGDSARFDFTAKLLDLVGAPLQLLPGTKIWFGVKIAPTDADPGIIYKKNAAAGAGGSDAQVVITSQTLGTFSVYATPTDTVLLVDDQLYMYDAVVELVTGERYTLGPGMFRAVKRITAIS